jgi:uroporphyrinogen-III synthase
MMAHAVAGRRVLVTRAREDAQQWASELSSLGALPTVFPCVFHEFIDDAKTASRLREALAEAEWLVLASARGAAAIARMLRAPLPAHVRIAAVGPATERAARENIGPVALMPSENTAAGLGRALAERCTPELGAPACRVVMAGARGGRNEAEWALRDAGVSVTRVDVYCTTPIPRVIRKRDFVAEPVDDVLLASPSAVTGLMNGAIIPSDVRVITIGPTTSDAVRSAGLRVFAEARYPTFHGMLEVM